MNIEILIYRSKLHKGYSKYERFRTEYYQRGDIVRKFIVSLSKSLERGVSWDEYSELKEEWVIDDPNMPEWLLQYISYGLVSENIKNIISQRNAEKIFSQIENYKSQGYETLEFEDNKYVVFKEKEILVCLQPNSVRPWVCINNLAKDAYSRERITSNLISQVKNDWLEGRVDYSSLIERGKINKPITIENKRKRLEAKKSAIIQPKMELLRQKVVKAIPLGDDETREELEIILELIEETEMTSANLAFLRVETWNALHKK